MTDSTFLFVGGVVGQEHLIFILSWPPEVISIGEETPFASYMASLALEFD